jgi:hypothetical protein
MLSYFNKEAKYSKGFLIAEYYGETGVKDIIIDEDKLMNIKVINTKIKACLKPAETFSSAIFPATKPVNALFKTIGVTNNFTNSPYAKYLLAIKRS